MSQSDIQTITRPARSDLLLALVVLGFLWFSLINQLRVEWTLNAQYNYGWAVPFLCVLLLWRRLRPNAETLKSETLTSVRRPPWPSRPVVVALLFALAFLWLPVRLIQEANPEWRLVSWALALITLGITLILLRMVLGGSEERCAGGSESLLRASHLAFPIAFFLVAVPWPTVIEGPMIQFLTRANATLTTELVNLFGIPAVCHGNVIEVATGVVGIDDACSGIRSFQAVLMIALFFGELHQLSAWRRLALCLCGFALSFVFNLIRTTLLTTVAARQGINAIAKWHDPAGVTILVGCFLTLWLLSLWFRKAIAANGEGGTGPARQADPGGATAWSGSGLFGLAAALLVWLFGSEAAVQVWYRMHERNLPEPMTWTVNWPEDNPTFRELPLSERTGQFLRFDEGRNAEWTNMDGTRWQAIFLRWEPGRTAVHLAKNHTPETCLTATGYHPVPDPELDFLEVNGLALPFRHYTIDRAAGPTHVYYCLWEDRAVDRHFGTVSLNYANRLEPVLAGRRLTGQRSLELVITGIADPKEARAALHHQLQQLIHGRR